MKHHLFALAMVGLLPLAALAQDGNGPCRPDVERFCRQAQGDPKGATDCLLDHQQEISDACYDKLKQQLSGGSQGGDGPGGSGGGPGGGKGGGLRACKQDAQALCKGVEPGGGRIVNCLMDHQKDLSDACYDQMSKRAKRNRS